jgi:hypothetical protein
LALSSALGGNIAIFLWSKVDAPTGLRLLTAASLGKDVSITFQASAETTNFVQAAPSPTDTFVDIGRILVSGSGLVTTNFTEAGAATNRTRFYRIRQLK